MEKKEMKTTDEMIQEMYNDYKMLKVAFILTMIICLILFAVS